MRRIALLVVIAAACAGIAFADRETAQFQAGRGDKALAAKKWDEAESCYLKALDEDATYLPARYGLAQALLGAGKSAPGMEELRKFIEEAHAANAPAADWKALTAKAEKQLGDADASGAALQRMLDSYCDSLIDVAQRWLSKDPDVAERALRRVVALRPGHAKAAELLAKLGKSVKSEVVDLFNGRDRAGWSMDAAIWEVVNGELVATCRDRANVCYTERAFGGDFVVRAEMRLIEQYAPSVMYGVSPCYHDKYQHYTLGMASGRVRWFDQTGANEMRNILTLNLTEMKKPVDPKQWGAFELRCVGKEVTVLLNGDILAKEPRTDARGDGNVGLFVQNGRVAFRKIQVELQ